MKRLVSPKYKKLIAYLESVIEDPRQSQRFRNSCAERLTRILLQSEEVTEKRAARRERDKIRKQKELENGPPPPPDVTAANVVASVIGGKK